MKAITLWQPWASLLALGLKHETRSWATSYRGLIAIHAAAKDVMSSIKAFPRETRHAMAEAIKPAIPPDGTTIHHIPRGAVIATGDLVECYKILGVRKHRLPSGKWLVSVQAAGRIRDIQITNDDLLFGDWSPGRYAWELANVRMLPEPIPAKGGQRIWEWEEEADTP